MAWTPLRSSRRILVVDDNLDVVEALSLLFRHFGHEVQAAYSGREALEMARNFLPDIVVLDIGLPQMDGFEVARKMRQRPETAKALLIAVTGYEQDDPQHAARAGFDHFLLKPVDPLELQKLLA